MLYDKAKYLILSLFFVCYSIFPADVSSSSTSSANQTMPVILAGITYNLDKKTLLKMPYFKASLDPDLYLQKYDFLQILKEYQDQRDDLTSYIAQLQTIMFDISPEQVNCFFFIFNAMRKMGSSDDIHDDLRNFFIKTSSHIKPDNIYETMLLAEKLLSQRYVPHVLDRLWVSMIKRRLKPEGDKIAKVFFSPKDRILQTLLGLIKAEKKQICLACYWITNEQIIHELTQAKERGVDIEIIVDASSKNDAKGSMYLHGLSFFEWHKPKAKMHHKFFIFKQNIFGQPLLVNGSFNCTFYAQKKNAENIIVLNDIDLLKQFSDQFEVLKGQSTPYVPFKSYHEHPATLLDRMASIFIFTPQAESLLNELARIYASYISEGLVSTETLSSYMQEQVSKQWDLLFPEERGTVRKREDTTRLGNVKRSRR